MHMQLKLPFYTVLHLNKPHFFILRSYWQCFKDFQKMYRLIGNKKVKTYSKSVKCLLDFTVCQPKFSHGFSFCSKLLWGKNIAPLPDVFFPTSAIVHVWYTVNGCIKYTVNEQLFAMTLFRDLPEMNLFAVSNFHGLALFTLVSFIITIWQILVRDKKYSRQIGSLEHCVNFSHANKSRVQYLFTEQFLTKFFTKKMNNIIWWAKNNLFFTT